MFLPIIGLPDPELLLTKAKLSVKIERLVKGRCLTQGQEVGIVTRSKRSLQCAA